MPESSHYGPFLKSWPEIWYGNVLPVMDQVWANKKKPEEVMPDLMKQLNKKFFPTK